MLKIIAATVLGMALLTNANAREKTGNGGGVHVCHLPSGETTYEMYDLYEGRHPLVHKMKGALIAGGSTDEILESALKRLRSGMPSLAAKVEAALLLVDRQLADPEGDVGTAKIPPTRDADIMIVGEGCEYVQAANWNDRIHRLIYKRSILDELDPAQLAALRFHEAVYWVARMYSHATDSDETRRFVAAVFLNGNTTTPIASDGQSSGIAIGDLVNWTNPECYSFFDERRQNRMSVTVDFHAPTFAAEPKGRAGIIHATLLSATWMHSPTHHDRTFLHVGEELTREAVGWNPEGLDTDPGQALYLTSGNVPLRGMKLPFTVTVTSPHCNESVRKSGAVWVKDGGWVPTTLFLRQ